MCVCVFVCRGQRRPEVWDPLELELQVAVPPHVGAWK